MITPEIKLRTFSICWFVSKENTGKQMLMKRLMDFSMYNTLTTPSAFEKQNKNKVSNSVGEYHVVLRSLSV